MDWPSDPSSNNEDVSELDAEDMMCEQLGGLCDYEPGLRVRVYQDLVDLIKKHYAPRALQYWEYEFPVPKTGKKENKLFPFYFTFYWTNAIETEPISVDLQHFIFNFDQ